MARATVLEETQVALFAASRRRCCVCVALHHDRSIKPGQIAHLNHDSLDSRFDNLAWLCLAHHDIYDSTTRQSKGITLAEIRYYRDQLYQEMSSETTAASQEIDFLRAYLRIIESDISPSHRYIDIVAKHLELLRSDVKRLQLQRDWQTLLEVRSRLRECFEYSGRYKDGWTFGYAYVDALRALERHHERRWVQVKDIGYMYILDGEYLNGRHVIENVLEELSKSPSDETPQSTAALKFYAYRYIGISFQRAKQPDLMAAESNFDQASKALEALPEESPDRRALRARILGNFGNLSSDRGNLELSLNLYGESLKEFEELHDIEHEGIANLNIAKTLICLGDVIQQDPLPNLSKALSSFSQIAWLEGQGRVHEQLAHYYLLISQHDNSEVNNAAHRSLFEADTALGIFRRIQSERWCGRLEGLRDQIRQNLRTLK
jgi:tetratricopeptide (TPR) repeat protein